MNKKSFEAEIKNVFGSVLKELSGAQLESVTMWGEHRISSVFSYAAISERCMEKQLADMKGCERHWTFMSDFSIGEWVEGWRGLFDTIKRCMLEYRDNEEAMAEFILCVNWKSWEHHARNNSNWSRMYSLLYHGLIDLLYRYYENDANKTAYLFNYLD